MKIFKDVLDKELAEKANIYYAQSSNVKWVYNYGTTANPEDNLFQFLHPVCMYDMPKEGDDADFLILNEVLKQTLKKDKVEVRRAKFNLLPKQPYTQQELDKTIHQDHPEDGVYKSMIYYLNDSDGDTVIYEDGKEIRYTPKANTAIMFDSELRHRATPPTKEKTRVVLNIVFNNKEAL